ncbi:MAG: C40 family peptidase [Dorea sp.]|nr:C40 family peptidase [Dorea sp.]
MRNKILILVITIIIGLGMITLAVIDYWLMQKQLVSAEEGNTGIRKEKVEEVKIDTSIHVEEKGIRFDDRILNDDSYLILAVGETGNLKDGGYAPVYERPDKGVNEIAELQYNCGIEVSAENLKPDIGYQWIPVKIPNANVVGYVNSDEISIENVKVENVTGDERRDMIIRDAVSYIGLNFVRYGDSLESGIDCANFIRQLYERAGVDIAEVPNKMRKQSEIISKENALPGDLVYYPVNDGYGHVGIYLGGDLMINSAGHAGKIYPQGGVRICRLQYKDREEYEFCKIIK